MREGIVISPCPIAIVGVGTLFPGSQNPFGFWRDILLERDLITEVPPEYWLVEDCYDPDPRALDKVYAKRGAFFREPVVFDCMEFGILPKNVEQIDVTQLLALWVAKQAFEDATDKDLSKLDRERTSVFVGVSGALQIVTEQSIRTGRPYLVKTLREMGYPEDKVQAIVTRFLEHCQVPNESSFPGGLANVVAGRIANHFDLKGTNYTTDAACGSSLSALKTAIMELWLGDADCCLAGGADTLTGSFTFSCFSKTPALSFSDEIRPFSADADGTLLGEGVCFFVLKRLADAERDGDKIYAVIHGIGSSSDGSGTAIYAPKQEGQILALKRAYARAGYGPETVGLLEAHGTGTRAGDVVEFKAASQVFRETDPKRKQWCALGSVKSQIGHTKGTAGAASLFKATMALHHQALPPTLKVMRPNPEFHIEESPFYLNTRTRPWFHLAPYPRRASVSAFGFGGSNFHVTLEEYHGHGRKPWRFRPSPTELLLVSGQSIKAMYQQVKNLLDGRSNDDGFRFACRQSQLEFNVDDPVRLGIVAESAEKALDKLASLVKSIEPAPEKDHILPQMFYVNGHKRGKIAFLFPGQGSQYLYMGSDLAVAFPEARIPWEKARELCLSPDVPLDEIAMPKPAFTEEAIQAQTQRLTETQNAQPAIGLVSAGMLSILKKLGITPDMAAGHSFGELSALYAAGVFTETSFLKASRCRGELMAQASTTPGAMIAVFAPQQSILDLLSALDLPIVVANFNAPLQTVLSGDKEAVELLEKELVKRKMDFRRLPVATAFHSPLVESAVLPFAQFLQGLECQELQFPVYANSTAKPYPQNGQEIKTILAKQLANPVRFAESIEAMHSNGAKIFIEVGPGQVLSQLVREILKGKEAAIVQLDQKGQHGLTSLWQGLGQLAVFGLPINWASLWEGIAPFDDPRAKKKPKVAVELYGYNYNRPYPPKGGAAALPKPNPPQDTAPFVPPTAEISTPKKQAETTQLAQEAFLREESPNLIQGNTVTPSIMASKNQPFSDVPDMTIPSEEMPIWLSVIRDMQRQTTATHQQFLQVADRSLQALEMAILGGQVTTSAQNEWVSKEISSPSALATERAQVASPVPVARKEEQNIQTKQPAENIEIAKAQSPFQPELASVPAAAQPVGQQAPMMTPEEFLKILLDVVADKTGYPLDLLEPSMDIETDLGIDSIKRVEILSALQEKIPNLPEVDLTEVAALRTLGEIANYIEKHAGEMMAQAGSQPELASVPAAAQPVGQQAPMMTPEEFLKILLDVVADKTGYPLDLLEPSMDIETDLGIDSIKRVEILSALQEKIPNLPEVDLTEVAALRTLGEIANYIEKHAGEMMAESGETQAPVSAEGIELPKADSGIRRFVVAPTKMPLSTFVLPRLLDQETVYITPDAQGVAKALREALKEAGIPCEIKTDIPETAKIVVCLEGLNEPSSIDEALKIQEQVFARLTKLAQTFEKEGGTLVIVQDTKGNFGRSGKLGNRAWLGGLTGLAKTAYLEWPKASVRVLDLDTEGKSAKEITDGLVHEFFYGGSDIEVGISEGNRVRLGLVEKEIDQTLPPRLGKEDVVVATGGARGVTAACMIELAKISQAKMVLLGRTALEDEPAFCAGARDEAALKKAFLDEARARGEHATPAILSKKAAHVLGIREIKATLQAIRGAGSEVIYEACDIANEDSLKTALEKARQAFGPITVLVHGAGVLADKKLSDKTPEHFQQVFLPKVVGLQNLLQATQEDPIKAMVFFSSVAGRFGNMGQADYAMANEILARVAFEEKRNRPGCLVKSIAWGPWEGGMVSPMLKELFTKFGVAVIPIAEGARRFVEEIQWGDEESPEVLIGGGEPKISPTSAMGNAPERRFDILVEKQRQPYLTSHIIHGRVVAPSVIAIEYALRAGRSLTPHLQPYLLQDLKIIRGLTWSLSEFDRERTILVMTLKEDLENPNVIYATLKDQRGLLRYSGTLVMSENPKVPEGPTFSDSLPVQIGPDELYDGKALFHGPDFYAITSITGMDEKCIQGNLVGGVDLHWPQEDWVIDPPLLDGALQLSHIWGRKIRNIFVLPSACSAIYVYQRGLRQGRMRCEVAIVRANNLSLKGNLSITDQEGQIVIAVEGLEGFVVPSEAIAQLENTGQQLKTGGE